MSDVLTRQDFEAQIISRALRDEEYRQRLTTDPKAVIAEELAQMENGITIADDIEVEVLAETPHKRYLVLPMTPAVEKGLLSADELEAVAGGARRALRAEDDDTGGPDKDTCCCMRNTRQNTVDSTASFSGALRSGARSIYGSFSG
jgi:hypothetical protein